MKKGFVVSDIHMFTSRSEWQFAIKTIKSKAKTFDFCVLNGDIFDFRWGLFPTVAEHMRAGKTFLTALCEEFPNCVFYYVLGNHDRHPAFIRHLNRIEAKNFIYALFDIRLGNNLFLHGDHLLSTRKPVVKRQHRKSYKPDHLFHYIYAFAVEKKIHTLFEKRWPAKICAIKIINGYRNLIGIKKIYFGHTHSPFSDYRFKGIEFTNTGSFIKNSQSIIGTAEYDD